MQRVSQQPEFRERVLDGIREVPKVGEFLSPDLLKRLRVLILGKQWQRVDHFPALPVAALNQSADATDASGREVNDASEAERSAGHSRSYSLEQAKTQSIWTNLPRRLLTQRILATAQRQIGFNLTMGDGPDPALAPMHAESRATCRCIESAGNERAWDDPRLPRVSMESA